jgi:acyl-CoA hydrolase
VVIGQGCAEPVPLVDSLLDQVSTIGQLSAFVGITFGDRLAERASPAIRFVSYGALGGLRALRGLEIVPCHFSALPRLFALGELPCDVALIQVAPPDGNGRCSFGVGADYLADAVEHARVVIAEVNDHCPVGAGAWISWDKLDVAVATSRPLLEAPVVSPAETDLAIAGHVAELVDDGDTIQLGVGALPEAILAALRGHRRLGVHSGMISDGILDLIECGAITGEDKPVDTRLVVTGAALGTRRLFDALGQREEIVMRPVSYTHSPVSLARVGPICAINSALEVDLTGQANSESIGGRQLGAIGGQVDFLRAAAASGGKPIIALPASRIVKRLHGPVSTSGADVDWVITEYGARSLSALSVRQRAEALLEIAGPHADELT